jgi:hypothetical protein
MPEVWRDISVVIVVALVVSLLVVIPRRAWTIGGFLNAATIQSVEPHGVIGGAAWAWHGLFGRATAPFVRISIYSWGILVEPANACSKWYVPRAVIPWDQISSAMATRAGVVIRVSSVPSGFLRLSTSQMDLASEMRRHGVSL